MRLSVLIVAFPVAFLSANPALALDMCIVEGNAANMGANGTAAFGVQAGQGCMSDIRPHGTLCTLKISQRAQHRTAKLVDKDPWIYEPAPSLLSYKVIVK